MFATALTLSRRYRSSEGTVVAWLLGIARNKLRESRRRGRVESSARRRLGVQSLQITDHDLDRVEELASRDREILAALDGLPEDQREALRRRVLDERAYTEIADELGCSEAVVRKRVSRGGLMTLRGQMAER